MNLPVGSLIKEGVKLSDVNFSNIASTLMSESFSGYIIITIEGYSGIEEGMVLFRKGELIGSIFDYTKFEVTVYGDAAAEQVFNASKAKHGIFDICSLNTQQVDLITAFNEKVNVENQINAKNLNRMIPSTYDAKYAKKVLVDALKKEESKYEIFKKLGLSDIHG